MTLFSIDIKLFYTIIFIICIPIIFVNKLHIVKTKSLLLLSIWVVSYSLIKLFLEGGEGTRMAVIQIVGTPLLLSSFPIWETISYQNYKVKFWRHLFYTFILFFIVETGIAILERFVGYNFFEWKADEVFSINYTGNLEFRSCALHGHPLYNALLVTTSMSFILISPLKLKYKLSLWSLGYMSILCFNTRSSMVGNFLLLLTYLIYTIFFDKSIKKKIKRHLLISSISIICLASFFIISKGWGGRLLEMGLFDDSSAIVRVNSWNIFNYFDISNFLWGLSRNEITRTIYSSGLHLTENFLIDQILLYGLVFYIPYVTFTTFLCMYLLKDYSLFQRFFVSGSFLLIAVTNNSLSSNFYALFFFIILICLFNPRHIKTMVHKKYIQKNYRHDT